MKNPELAELARVAAGLTQGQLAKMLGKSQPFVSQVERGEREIPADLRDAWAALCEVPSSYFTRAHPPLDDSVSGIIHRQMKTLPAKPFHRGIAHVKLRAIAVDALFGEVDVVPALQIPELPIGTGPADAAASVRREWRLPSGPVGDLTGLIESTGIPVLLMDEFHEKQSATSQRGRWFEWVITVNGQHPASRQRFTLAHELGHIVLGHDTASSVGDQWAKLIEREADAFAAALLFPRKDARRELRTPDFRRLVYLKQRWRVAISFLIRRALDAEMIDAQQRRKLEIILSTQPGGRRREPAEFSAEEPTLIRRMIEGLQQEGADLTDIASLMDITDAHLRSQFLRERPRLHAVRAGTPRTVVQLDRP